MRRYLLLATLATAACSARESQAPGTAMVSLVGSSEQALIAGMGRAPDATSEPAPDTKVLLWRWQKSYVLPNQILGYSYGGGTTRPIPNSHTGIVLDGCVTEWTVEHGIATRYQQEGNACSLPVLPATPKPKS